MIKKYWQKLSYLGVKPAMEMEQQKKIILSNQISVFFFVVFTILNILIEIFYVRQSIYTHLSVSTLLLMLIFNHKGFYKVSAILVCILTPAFTLLFTTISKLDVVETPIYGYIFPRVLLISFVSIPFILISKRNSLLMYSMMLYIILFVYFFDIFHNFLNVGFFQVNLDLKPYYVTNFYLIFPIVIIVLGYIFLTNINTKYENKVLQLIKELEDKNKDIIEKNRNITDSIRYAKKIQTAFLPKKENIEDLLPNSFILYLPRDIVSGDFYWIRKIDNLQVIIIADCTGHGVPGAFLSILGTTLLNDIIVSKKIIKPNEILDELRVAVINSLNQYGTTNENKDGMDVSVCIYNPENNILEYSGANNSLYIIRQKQLIEYKANNQPVGLHRKEKPFTFHEIQLFKNDCFFMFSDGYYSQFGGQKNEVLKTSRFKDYLLTIAALNISQQKNELETMLKNWQGNNDQIDDILVMGVKIV